jgi:cellulose synthase (UDP-forming)
VALAAGRWLFFPGDRPIVEIVGAWAVFNMLLTGLALRAVAEKQQRRSVPRIAMQVPAEAWIMPKDAEGAPCAARGAAVQAVIMDASTSGVRLQFRATSQGPESADMLRRLDTGARVTFRPLFPEARNLERDILADVQSVARNADGPVAGLRFVADQPIKTREAVAYLMFNDSENWRRMRQDETAPRGLIHGLLYVFWLSLVSIPRTLADFAREPARRRRKAAETSDTPVPVHLLAFGADFETRTAPDPTVHTLVPARDRAGSLDFILEEGRS